MWDPVTNVNYFKTEGVEKVLEPRRRLKDAGKYIGAIPAWNRKGWKEEAEKEEGEGGGGRGGVAPQL